METGNFKNCKMVKLIKMIINIKNLIISMRPKQWIKNLFIFSALIFVKEFTDVNKILLTLKAFGLFCLASSAIYLINDIVDAEQDRRHSFKKMRPLAAGRIKPRFMAIWAALFVIISLAASFYLNFVFGFVIGAYILLNFLYSFYLKNIIILDVFTIAVGFVLRVIAGAVIISVPFSAWLILCTFFLTLFLAINKRKAEIYFVQNIDNSTRQILKEYSISFLDQMNIVALTATIISYTFYTFSSEHSRILMITIPIVLYGLFYYLFVVIQKREGDSGPSDIFLREKPLQITVFLWLIVVILILIYGK